MNRQEAREQVAGLGEILDNSWNEIYVFDAGTLKFIRVNRGARENLGYSMAELHDLTPVDLKPSFTVEGFVRELEPLRGGEAGQVRFETEHKRKDGSFYPVEVHVQLSLLDESPVFVAVILDITERRRAQQALEESRNQLQLNEEHLRTIIENAPVGICTADTKGNIKTANRAFARMFGYTRKELLQLSIQELTHPDDREATFEKMKELWTGKISHFRMEKRYIRKTGAVIHGAGHVALVSDIAGSPRFSIAQVEDITKRKLSERRIEGLNRMKEKLIMAGDLTTKARRITDSMIEIFNADFARLWIIKPGDRCESGCYHAAAEKGPHVCRRREHCLHLMSSSGRYTHIDGKAHQRVPFGCYKIGRVASGSIPGFVTNNVADDPRIHDPQWVESLGLVSAAGHRLLSPEGEPIGVLSMFSKNEISTEEETLLQTIAGTASHVIQTALADEHLQRHHDELEQLVKERTKMLRLTQFSVEHSGEAVFMIEPAGSLFYINEAACRSLGYTHDELLTKKITDIDPDFTPERWPDHWREIRERGSFTIETRHRTKSGRIFPVEVTVNHVVFEGNEYNCAFIRDISDRKKAETDLRFEITQRRQAEDQLKILVADLERVNKELEYFAYIVSHDLKAPLRGIISLADWLKEDYGEQLNGDGREYLDKMINRTRRMNNLIDGILQYSHIGRAKIEPKALDSHELVQQVIEDLSIPGTVTVTIIPPLPSVTHDRTLLAQVFQNLIGNAVKHMGKPDGTITVSCNDRGRTWEFSVSDDGVGIEEKYFEKIFKMFQGLKPRNGTESSGIGLALVKKIVQRSNGDVWVTSTPGQGSAFFFTVPKEQTGPAPQNRYTVLVVDDNTDFLNVARTMLELEEHQVLCATGGPEAVQILETHPGDIHVALMDVNIPGENPFERFAAVRQQRPGIKIVICTGSGLTDVVASLQQQGVDGVLTKPFTLNALYSVLEPVNDDNRSPA